MDQTEALVEANALFQGYGETGTTTENNGSDYWIGWRTPLGATCKWYGESWEDAFKTYELFKKRQLPSGTSLAEVLNKENQTV